MEKTGMNASAWGIDLGTTNSCIARATADGVEVIAIDEALTVPSVLAWDGAEFLVGRRAANRAVLAPDQAVRSIKRHMGEEGHRQRLGGVELSPVEVSAKILQYLKTAAERATGETVKEAVITVPAWFNEPQRRATLLAGERAGLKVTRIINEPTAAGLAYGHSGASASASARPATGTERWLVYDLGGGTFDVSILAVTGDYKEVLASCGNTYLGGDDFDHRIVLRWVDRLRDRHNTDVSQDKLAMAQLRHLAEQTKMRLSSEVEVPVHLDIESAGRHLALEDQLTRAEFASMIDDYVESTLVKAHQALEEAHLRPQDLQRALLVGGSTRIPRVRERLAQEFGIEPDAYVDADLSVALGAALQSALDHHLSAAQIVVDIVPHSLGIAALGEEDQTSFSMLDFAEDGDGLPYPRTFVPLIRRNTRLPARFVEQFCTVFDDQDGVEVVVLQGESRNTRENTLVGTFHVAFEPKPAGTPICVGFEYDRSGLMRVSVSDQSGGKLLKSRTLDLHRSAASNSELASLQRLDDGAAAAAYDDESAAPSPQISNFLVEQVERYLPGAAEADRIRACLQRYRELLAAGSDAELDPLEDALYTWLDQVKATTGADS